MSRARVHEVSSPISLFPFIGILLCTMGALLVVLVAVSRSARDTAQEQVHARQSGAQPDVDTETKQKVADARQYISKLTTIRGEAERKLRDENARLSHVEEHIRRLHERMRTLQISAEEIEALEQDHYDDREQAERETARLNQLIAQSRTAIDTLQEAADKEPTSYALVPYEGPNGTFRRPIYIECIKDAAILQPEGVRILASDLRPPFGAGNPLAAALRAARDHYVQLSPKEGKSRETEPYPLLLVRPDGLSMFGRARQAIEAGDFDLGFELVESDWKLKYPQPNPQLASIEQVAVEQARVRQEVLAAAAPRAYRDGSLSFADRSGSDDDGFGGGGGTGGYGGAFGGEGEFDSGPSGIDGGSSGGGTGNGVGSTGPGYGRGGGGGAGGGGGGGSVASGNANPGGGGGGGGTGAASGGNGELAGGPAGYGGAAPQGGAPGTANAGGSMAGSGGAGNAMGNGGSFSSSGGGMPAVPMTDPNAPPDAPGNPTNVSVMMGSPPPNAEQNPSFDPASMNGKRQVIPPEKRNNDWALHKKGPKAVPVRRTIRVVVGQNQVAILSDGGAKTPEAARKAVVPFHGDTVESVDEFVKHVQREIEGWGIAGNGLYWRPVLVLSVSPDGTGRANDLARLLKNSGLELKADEVARNDPSGGPHEAR